MNAIFKVSGTEFVPGMQDGNVAMGSFNQPSSIAVFDNNPMLRKEQDNLILIRLHDKFFAPSLNSQTQRLKETCLRFAHQSNFTLCGTRVSKEFEPPSYTEQQLETLSDE
mmetsp:Transcript_14027/g.23832  ORF Transcript_14027/g.23832 Transcript_14027/m.23832 type:complete len:110 (-) Transcript_14027:861-1190(-)